MALESPLTHPVALTEISLLFRNEVGYDELCVLGPMPSPQGWLGYFKVGCCCLLGGNSCDGTKMFKVRSCSVG